jgi:hypothetical protein
MRVIEMLNKISSTKLQTVLEWLVEVWALVRGLTILVLVLGSILINVADHYKITTFLNIH